MVIFLHSDFLREKEAQIIGPFLLVLGLQDQWQPIREEQLAMRTNDWPGQTGPKTNIRGPTIVCLSFQFKSHAISHNH